jgi:hypothetical protein
MHPQIQQTNAKDAKVSGLQQDQVQEKVRLAALRAQDAGTSIEQVASSLFLKTMHGVHMLLLLKQ